MTCSVTWRVAGVGVFGTRSGWPGLIVAAIRAVLQGAGVVFRRAFVRVASISKADLGGSLTRLEARFCDLECSIDRPDGGVDSLAHRLAQVLVGCAAGQLMIPNCAAATVTPAAPRKRRRCQAMSSAVLIVVNCSVSLARWLGNRSAERERKGLHSRSKKLDLELAIENGFGLPDQLIEALVGQCAVALRVNVGSVSRARCPPVVESTIRRSVRLIAPPDARRRARSRTEGSRSVQLPRAACEGSTRLPGSACAPSRGHRDRQ